MEPFRLYRGKLGLLDRCDVDTDTVIPARYLSRIERDGYGPLLFADHRYAKGSAPPADAPNQAAALNPEFPLNAPQFEGASLLLVNRNFGCGSSREHAAWAIRQAGFRAVIAPGVGTGFADIFRTNAVYNGLPPIEVPTETWGALAQAAQAPGGAEASIDLDAQTITLHPASGPETTFPFEMAGPDRRRLLEGIDAVTETLGNHDDAIRAYERQVASWVVPRTS